MTFYWALKSRMRIDSLGAQVDGALLAIGRDPTGDIDRRLERLSEREMAVKEPWVMDTLRMSETSRFPVSPKLSLFPVTHRGLLVSSSTMNLPYEVGHRVKRRQIHERFGGNPQCGISGSGQVDAIFLFTGDSGDNPYEDIWVSETEFEYSGQGRRGDQTFDRSTQNGRANDDLRNHEEYGKEVHLFEKSAEDSSIVVYLGELEYVDDDFKQRRDADGNYRDEIRFELQLVEDQPSDEDEVVASGKTLRELAEEASQNESTSSSRGGRSYSTSKYVREYALEWADGYCQGCNGEAPFKTSKGDPYLEVHHVFRRADGGPDHPDAVIALCPNCHSKRHYGQRGSQFNRELIEKLHDRAMNEMGEIPPVLQEETD